MASPFVHIFDIISLLAAEFEKPKIGISGKGLNVCFCQSTDGGINPFPNNPRLKRLWDRRLLKTLWEKEKMLLTSIFSFYHNVFYPVKDKFYFLSYIYFVDCTCIQIGEVKIRHLVKSYRKSHLETGSCYPKNTIWMVKFNKFKLQQRCWIYNIKEIFSDQIT